MSSLLALATLLPALAGPAQDIVAALDDQASSPRFAMGCSSVREAVEFADATGALADRELPDQLAELMLAVKDPAVEERQRLDLDGAFMLLLYDEQMVVELPVQGDFNDAIALFTEPEQPQWTLDGDHRAVRIADDGSRSLLTMEGGKVRLKSDRAADPRSSRSGPSSTATLASLPDSTGCAMWMDPSGDPDAPPFLQKPIALWMPFGAQEAAELRFELPPHRDRAAVPTITPPLAVSTPERPTAVFTLGVPVTTILRSPTLQPVLPEGLREALRVELGAWDALAEKIQDPGAGAVAALFLTGGAPQLVVAFPVRSPRGRPVSQRRIVKGFDRAMAAGQFKRYGATAEAVDRATTRFTLANGREIWLVADRGRVLLSSSDSLARSAAEGLGEPWLDASKQAWAADHAVTLTGEGPLPGLSKPLTVQLGATTEGDVFSLQLMLDPSLRDPELVRALQAMSAARKAKKQME